jgi:uncharacterized membrane protein YebE (DUF533 family)
MPVYLLYLIIFGTRGVTYNAAEGNFHCPSCGPSPYRHRRVRRFFTLYFIPLIPLDMLGEYVECGGCRDTYRTEVLTYQPGPADQTPVEFEAQYHLGIRRTMVLMCLADGVVDPNEVETIRTVYGKIVHREITTEAVYAEIAAAQTEARHVTEYLTGLAPTLNDTGKELVVQSAFWVAAADGQFQDEEHQMLQDIGKALQMTPAHLRGVLDGLMNNANAA